MKAMAELLVSFERAYQDPESLVAFVQQLKMDGQELNRELALGLIAIDANRELETGVLPDLKRYTEIFQSLVVHEIEATLLETIQEFTDTFCPIGSELGPLPVEFNGYRFHREIGRGATGVVYEAEQLSLGRTVAAKVHFLNQQPSRLKATEASLLATIEHACIPTIFDHSNIGDRPCLFMTMIDGLSLRRYCSLQSQVSLERAIRWMIQLTSAIEECHQHGVLHCDLKPENVLMCDDRPFVVDFGLACPLGRPQHSVCGSPGYLPPELLRDERQPIMTSGDIYALGVILYELLTSYHPFPNEDFDQPPRRLPDLRPEIDSELESICYRALAINPSERYLSAESFRLDLEAWYTARGENQPRGAKGLWKWLSEHAASFLA